ncbi:MAG: glycine zipper domain-containing protein [Candidatus Omnitrophica bacterium]|nr:glycine zipper domain-containing protein [Candidatus Omnitrophota bacterium]
MKKVLAVVLSAGLVVVALGCETNKTRVAEGAGIGGAVGALAGGIIGHQSGSGLGGALIGGAVGAGAGALVGAQIDKPGQKTEVAATEQVTMQQVVDMTSRKTSDDFIIDKIRSTNTKLVLTTNDIDYLRKNKVSQRVIEALQGK